MKALIICLALSACACAKAGVRQQEDPRAVALIDAFIRADTMGQADSAYALIYQPNCEILPVADFIQPTRAVRVLGSRSQGDTTLVDVEYATVGRATSDDARRAGAKNWRFAPEPRVDTAVFAVAPDSSGRLWIDCGPHPPIHLGLAIMASYVTRFDDASRVSWDSLAGSLRRP